MNIVRKIEVFGDSILKGIQLNPRNKRYCVDNNIDVDLLSSTFSLDIVNRSRFGCTVKKGLSMLNKYLDNKPNCSVILMNYGGNDCDFDWKAISENPDEKHEPNTPIKDFISIYTGMIEHIYKKGIRPVITNLPPLDPQQFFDWFFKGLNKDRLLNWLGGVNRIYRFQEYYSHTIEEIARATGTLIVDLRGAFLKEAHIGTLLCIDGVHPNTEGQKLITQEFTRFCATALS